VVECFVVALGAALIDETLALAVEVTGGSRHDL
jgi:hypothetical protein